MNVVVVLEAEIKVGKMTVLNDLLTKYLPQTRNYKGFVNISIHQQIDSSQVMFYEEWESIEYYESYLKWRTETGVMDILGETFVNSPSVRYFSTMNLT